MKTKQTRPPLELLPGAIVAKAKILIEKIKTGKFELEQSKLNGNILYLKLVQYPGYLAINVATNKVYLANEKFNKLNSKLDEVALVGVWYYLESWTK